MIRIQVLGLGCQKCERLYQDVVEAAEELGLQYEIEKITDLEAIVSHGVMATPALVVNGELKVTGRVPSVRQLKEALS